MDEHRPDNGGNNNNKKRNGQSIFWMVVITLVVLLMVSSLTNRVSSLTMVCPITHTDRNHTFHLRLDGRTKTDGVILCDQARMLDLRSRHAAFAERAPEEITAEAVDMILGFLEMK